MYGKVGFLGKRHSFPLFFSTGSGCCVVVHEEDSALLRPAWYVPQSEVGNVGLQTEKNFLSSTWRRPRLRGMRDVNWWLVVSLLVVNVVPRYLGRPLAHCSHLS